MPLVFRILAMQGAVAAMLTTMFLTVGRSDAVSALLGAVVVIVPSLWFAWRVTTINAPVGQELDAARRLLGGGIAKVIATFGLLVAAFAWAHPEPVAFFVTMFGVQMAHMLAPLSGSDT